MVAVRRRGHAMGTDYEIVVAHPDRDRLDQGEARLRSLEARWSRFRPDSEISRLNRAAGVPVIVSPATFSVVADAVDGARATGGRFDPTVHDAMVAHGYDRDLRTLVEPVATTSTGPVPGVEGIELDPALHAITLPHGTSLDLGGIGKGAAADLVADELIAAGAAGVAVSIGGDLRVRGTAPSGAGWRIHHDHDDATMGTLADGAVCTSSTRRRRWRAVDGVRHHVLDPRTGSPTDGPWSEVTIVAATARQAEVLAKAALVAGEAARDFLASFPVEARFVAAG